jgi:flavin-dependent thymidylate synthase
LKNTVELLGYYGSDETIACSAWTSTSRELTEDKKARIPKLINMLWSQGHETPFEKASVHFLVNTEIASHIHILKHRISSLNAESARYKELKENKYYIPEDWNDIQRDVSIPPYDLVDNNAETWSERLEKYTTLGNKLYHQCVKELEPILGRKRAKESARFFKTYNSQIQADVMFNMRSFANFQKLRNSEHSQLEIREISGIMLELVKNIEGRPFKHTLSAWSANAGNERD